MCKARAAEYGSDPPRALHQNTYLPARVARKHQRALSFSFRCQQISSQVIAAITANPIAISIYLFYNNAWGI